MMMKSALIAVLLIVGIALAKQPVNDWSKVKINPNTFTVSGVSTGGAMAIQYEFAWSATVRAAGIIAGLPYWCAQGTFDLAISCAGGLINKQELLDVAYLNAAAGELDPLSNLANHTVLLFSGTNDTMVSQGTMAVVSQMYSNLNVTSLRSYFNYSAGHAWITNSWGNPCSGFGSPFINNCDLDFAGEYFHQAFDHMKVKFNPKKGQYNASNMYEFNMAPFGATALISMDTTAYLYVPAQCASGKVQCHLHANFHGCNQQRTAFPQPDYTIYVSHTELNEWAETNNIVIFYPQTIASLLFPENPVGCFDWWGYTGSNYATKAGAQMAVINTVVEHFLRQ